MGTTEIVIVPGNPEEWREFACEDYDPEAEVGGDDDELGALIAERTKEEPFGVVITTGPIENVPDDVLRRLARQNIPTKVRRASHEEYKPSEKKDKKDKKSKKDKD